MPSEDLEVTRAVVQFLLHRHGGTQKDFAQAAGVDRSTISRCVTRRHAANRQTLAKLAKLAKAARVEPAELEALLDVTRAIYGQRAAGSGRAIGPALHPAGLIERLDAFLTRRVRSVVLAGRRTPAAAPTGEQAAALWARLVPYTAAQRRAVVEDVEDFHVWELADLLCNLCLAAAPTDAAQALDLAGLAVQVATLAPGGKVVKARREAHALAHLANARKVCNDLRGAGQVFATVEELWARNPIGEPGTLNDSRVLGFKASWRAAQRHFQEALNLLESAIALDRWAETPYLLLTKAKLLCDCGDLPGALRSLEEAEAHLESIPDRRLALVARSNAADFHSLLGHYDEAARRLPEVWKLAAEQSAGELDRLRLTWIQGRVDAGTGRPEEGVAALEQVQQAFTVRKIPYDQALVSLELAVIHLERGETARTRQLALEILPAFRSLGIHREALAAVTLFCRAAEQDRATAGLGRQVVRFLHSARHNPELRFEVGVP